MGQVVNICFVIVLPMVFYMLYLLFAISQRSRFLNFAYAIIAFFGFVFFGTEFLSLFFTISVLSVRLYWLIVLIILFFVCKMKKVHLFGRIVYPTFLHQNNLIEKILCGVIFCILLLSFFMSLFSVVNNGDSMAYHLPRVLHWLQDESVNYFYSQDIRQIYSPILSEYTLLHVFSLCGNDSLFNLLQWFSYGMIAFYLYAICDKLKFSKRFSLVAAILFLTMPMAIGQAMTTQVDLVGTMWVVIFLYLLLNIAMSDEAPLCKNSILRICIAAACVGLAYITKTNACIPMLFICLWFLICELRKRIKVTNILLWMLMAGGVVLAFVAPGMLRNLLWQGSLFSTEFSEKVVILTLEPRHIFVNMYKNISMELMQYIFAEVDTIILKIGGMLAGQLGVDINDALIGFGSNDYYATGTSLFYYFHHDHAGNPLVMVLGVISSIYAVVHTIRKKNSEERMIGGLVWAIIFGFFAMTIIIRWQPWVTRLLMPSLTLFIIPIILMLEFISEKIKSRDFLIGMIVCAVVMTSFNAFTYNIRVPFKNIVTSKDKMELYLYYHEEECEGYRAILDEIKEEKYRNLGLGRIDFEYVIWAQLWGGGYVLEHVPLEEQGECEFSPDCIIAFGYQEGDVINLNEIEYEYQVIKENEIGIYGMFCKKNI